MGLDDVMRWMGTCLELDGEHLIFFSVCHGPYGLKKLTATGVDL